MEVPKEVVAGTAVAYGVGCNAAALAVAGVDGTELRAPCTVDPPPCDVRAHDSCGTLSLVVAAAVVAVSAWSSPRHDWFVSDVVHCEMSHQSYCGGG